MHLSNTINYLRTDLMGPIFGKIKITYSETNLYPYFFYEISFCYLNTQFKANLLLTDSSNRDNSGPMLDIVGLC